MRLNGEVITILFDQVDGNTFICRCSNKTSLYFTVINEEAFTVIHQDIEGIITGEITVRRWRGNENSELYVGKSGENTIFFKGSLTKGGLFEFRLNEEILESELRFEPLVVDGHISMNASPKDRLKFEANGRKLV